MPNPTRITVPNADRAIDLGGMRPRSAREQEVAMALQQSGLVCLCGQRIRAGAVEFFRIVENGGPAGQRPSIRVQRVVLCGDNCRVAPEVRQQTVACRLPGGEVVWFDEQPATEAPAA